MDALINPVEPELPCASILHTLPIDGSKVVSDLSDRCSTWAWAVCVVALGICGCSTESPAVLSAESLMQIPQQFEHDGHRWQRKDQLDEADHRCLRRFFARHPEFVGSGDFETEPLVFRSGKLDRRFYWTRAGIETPAWVCVTCNRGRFAVTDGRGDPFSGSSAGDSVSRTGMSQNVK